ncbi:hypothetical protein MATL_G00065270 [Megalops atlanticus]|uniref:Arrestin C-terminal-like domain-containing protein n=1 Tax=Megalops atlanticus TaxID=7932 RepID=A0A9D3THS9_MEGAT|nr:hypothetical protein MATL_G00065270 [Megalops atlanticus]
MFQETFKSFDINFDALNERNSFSCGDTISGRITFETSKQIKVDSIIIVVKGKAKVSWVTGSRKHRRTHSARMEYFTLKSPLIKENNVAVGAGSQVLPKGTHVYPFSLQIPQGNFPSSFKGCNGMVTYYVQVEIRRPWHLAKEFRTDLNYISHIDANYPQLLAPLASANEKMLCFLCCASGPISMNVRLERKGYVPGEKIKIMADFENGSARTLVPKALLIQEQTFYTLSRGSSCHVPQVLIKVEGRPVTPYSSDVWRDQMLQIPFNIPLTISNCQILEVAYYLLVRLCIPGGRDLEVKFPLVICSIPVYSYPA